jgi:hypothetical protein
VAMPPHKYVRERVCCDCSKAESVRKDNKSARCKICASRISGAKGLETLRSRALVVACRHCGTPTRTIRSAPRQYCSMDCRREATSVARVCETCGAGFRVARSVAFGTSNSSARFCSRPCYERHLCRTERISGRGSQWNKARKEALRRTPFCCLCGTTKRLQVHHAVPFRLTFDNDQSNLFPLCVKHHKIVEAAYVETEAHGTEIAEIAWPIMLAERREATRAVLLGVWRGLNG